MIPMMISGLAAIALAAVAYVWGPWIAIGVFVAGSLLSGWAMDWLDPPGDDPYRSRPRSRAEIEKTRRRTPEHRRARADLRLAAVDGRRADGEPPASDNGPSEVDPLSELAGIVTGRRHRDPTPP
jgi:hypothetical protein